jgi:hypothetical protein
MALSPSLLFARGGGVVPLKLLEVEVTARLDGGVGAAAGAAT